MKKEEGIMPVVIPTFDPTRGGTTTGQNKPIGNSGSHDSGNGGNHGGSGRGRNSSKAPKAKTKAKAKKEEKAE